MIFVLLYVNRLRNCFDFFNELRCIFEAFLIAV